MTETYYTVLGVPRDASTAMVKTRYRELIREVHPDALPNASNYWKQQAEERTKDLNEAYKVLSDPEKRRLYDQQLDAYFRTQTTQASNPGSQTQQAGQTAANRTQSPPTGTNATTQQQRTPRGSTSADKRRAWAIWCLFWGIWWTVVLCSET